MHMHVRRTEVPVHNGAAALTRQVCASQMGGPEGVAKREETNLVTGIAGGMYLHAVPRVAPSSPAAATL